MVVDDEKHLLELVKVILTREGFDIILADNGKKCLSLLKHEKPDLILMDVMMPVMDGKDVVKKIRANPKTKNLKIIFLTILLEEEADLDFIKKNKISDWISKPFSNEELLMRVKKNLK